MPRTKTEPRVTGYCVKCQQHTEIENPEIVEMKNGRLAYQGYCPSCGTEVYRFISKEA